MGINSMYIYIHIYMHTNRHNPFSVLQGNMESTENFLKTKQNKTKKQKILPEKFVLKETGTKQQMPQAYPPKIIKV